MTEHTTYYRLTEPHQKVCRMGIAHTFQNQGLWHVDHLDHSKKVGIVEINDGKSADQKMKS